MVQRSAWGFDLRGDFSLLKYPTSLMTSSMLWKPFSSRSLSMISTGSSITWWYDSWIYRVERRRWISWTTADSRHRGTPPACQRPALRRTRWSRCRRRCRCSPPRPDLEMDGRVVIIHNKHNCHELWFWTEIENYSFIAKMRSINQNIVYICYSNNTEML